MKKRLDELLVAHGLASDLKKAHGLIGAGVVVVNDTLSDKAGNKYPPDVSIRIKKKCVYVSRGGLKLEKGLKHFQLNPTGLICLDIGASTGGFTDCLLQHGAAHVFAVDVAYGQFSWQLRQDKRVTVLERFNARKLTPASLSKPVDLAVIDASFISLTKLLVPIRSLFTSKIEIVALIKPQFELSKNDVGKGGVVRDKELHQKAIDSVLEFSHRLNLTCGGVVQSPILGPKGNTEFLTYFSGDMETIVLPR